jgi:hypothetical protein
MMWQWRVSRSGSTVVSLASPNTVGHSAKLRLVVMIEAGHLFPEQTTWLGFRCGSLLRGYCYDFIQLLAPHFDRNRIARMAAARTPAARAKLTEHVKIPRYD